MWVGHVMRGRRCVGRSCDEGRRCVGRSCDEREEVCGQVM